MFVTQLCGPNFGVLRGAPKMALSLKVKLMKCSIWKVETHNVGSYCETIVWTKFGIFCGRTPQNETFELLNLES